LKETGTVGKGVAPEGKKAAVTLILSDKDFGQLVAGKANAQKLFMSGKLKVKGDVMKVLADISILFETRVLTISAGDEDGANIEEGTNWCEVVDGCILCWIACLNFKFDQINTSKVVSNVALQFSVTSVAIVPLYEFVVYCSKHPFRSPYYQIACFHSERALLSTASEWS
jgi:hypothetical protein